MQQKYKYLIIGGGAAGVSASETIRSTDKTSSIAVISDEPHALYSRVMLSKPNFFLGKIPFEQIWMKSDKWYEENSITFLANKKVVSLDGANKTVTLESGEKISYEKLLIATGVNVRKWNVPGADKKGIHYLRTLEDGKAIMEHIKTSKRAVTIGGGFISYEMADLLKLAGLDTTMILRESYFWEPTLDESSGKMLENVIEKSGIKILRNSEVREIIGGESVEGVVLKDGTKIPCEMIICGIGVICPLEWLASSGIKVNRGILANEYLETSISDVFVAGDIAEYKDVLLEENIQMGNWVNAKEQGRIAGLNMQNGQNIFKFVSFYTTSGMGANIAFVGDVAPLKSRIIISRGSPEINSYARIIIEKNEIIGATMINRIGEMSVIAKLIEKNIDVSDKLKELADANFDLKQLLVGL